MSRQISELLAELQLLGLEVLASNEDARFQELSKRWTNIGREIPAAIVLPETEGQIQQTVQCAISHSVPFVPRSGGHSEWSTINDRGIIIDLTKYHGIDVDASNKKATLRGSILSKQVGAALADVGCFTALGNGNTVGAIPYFLGGGASLTTPITGFGADQILSARMVDAAGNVVQVTEEEQPDLLWAIRGAGQFFGLVTELTIRIHPLSLLGNDQGTVWMGGFVFPLDRAAEVGEAMDQVMNNGEHITSGLMMIMAPPPAHRPALVISARFFGDPGDAQGAYKPLYDLAPLAVLNPGPVPIQNASDSREALCAKGDFKRFGVVGLRRFDLKGFLQTVDIWKKLVQECSDAMSTAFNFQWDSRPPKQPEFESANSLHDIRFWQNNLIWHTDASNRQKVDGFNDECISVMRGPDTSEYADFQNGTRAGPAELRFRGEGKLEKLKLLKKRWDPQGVFTTQLLD